MNPVRSLARDPVASPEDLGGATSNGMKHTSLKRQHRIARHNRVRAKIEGTADRPRISVFKSNNNVFVQAIDDTIGKTIVSSIISTKEKPALKGNKTEKAEAIGIKVAEKMKEKGISKAVFDRGGFKFHGRIKAVAEGLRKAGIQF